MKAGIGVDCRWFVHTMQTHLNMDGLTIDVLYFIHLFITNKAHFNQCNNFLYCEGIQKQTALILHGQVHVPKQTDAELNRIA